MLLPRPPSFSHNPAGNSYREDRPPGSPDRTGCRAGTPSNAIGYGFFPILMSIAFGVLSRRCSVGLVRQGIPAMVRTLLRARSASRRVRVIRPDERGHAGFI